MKLQRLGPAIRRRLKEPVLLRVLLYHHDLGEIGIPTLEPGCDIRVLERGELGKLTEVGGVDEAEVSMRYERGDRCYGGFLDGRIAHYSWVQSTSTHALTRAGRRFSVQPGEFWIYNCRTAEWARGHGLYPAALLTILADYRRSGHTRCWIYTTVENVASQHGIARAGFVDDRGLRSLKLGPLILPLW